jgi:GDP-L-fucose synthase
MTVFLLVYHLETFPDDDDSGVGKDMRPASRGEQYGCDFISAMPTNLYGPGDNFDLESAHVLPAIMRRFRSAAHAGDGKVTLWGTGTPRREFLHVDDCADALVFLLRHYSDAGTINVGVGRDARA